MNAFYTFVGSCAAAFDRVCFSHAFRPLTRHIQCSSIVASLFNALKNCTYRPETAAEIVQCTDQFLTFSQIWLSGFLYLCIMPMSFLLFTGGQINVRRYGSRHLDKHTKSSKYLKSGCEHSLPSLPHKMTDQN